MKGKIIVPVAIAVVLFASFSIVTLFNNQSSKEVSETQYLKSKEKDVEREKKEKKLNELQKQQKEMEKTQGNTKEELDEYKELVAEIDEQEQDLGMIDYKEEFEISLDTTILVINDTKKELDRNGVPAELVEKEKARVKRLSKVVKKYEKYLKDKTLDSSDYQKLKKEMNLESESVITSLNKDFPIE